MGQAAVDLPDPLEPPLPTGAPSGAAGTDDLLAQLAGEEIDRLLAEAEIEPEAGAARAVIPPDGAAGPPGGSPGNARGAPSGNAPEAPPEFPMAADEAGGIAGGTDADLLPDAPPTIAGLPEVPPVNRRPPADTEAMRQSIAAALFESGGSEEAAVAAQLDTAFAELTDDGRTGAAESPESPAEAPVVTEPRPAPAPIPPTGDEPHAEELTADESTAGVPATEAAEAVETAVTSAATLPATPGGDPVAAGPLEEAFQQITGEIAEPGAADGGAAAAVAEAPAEAPPEAAAAETPLEPFPAEADAGRLADEAATSAGERAALDAPLPVPAAGFAEPQTAATANSETSPPPHAADAADIADAADVEALIADDPHERGDRTPLYLLPLEWLNAPLDSVPESVRDIIGKIAIVTLVNAVAVLIYVLFFRR